jgi:hypothetical protein
MSAALRQQLFINGGWRDGAGPPLDVVNPATEEVTSRRHEESRRARKIGFVQKSFVFFVSS